MKQKRKECRQCGRRKPLTEFYKNVHGGKYYSGMCKACWKIKNARRRKKIPLPSLPDESPRCNRCRLPVNVFTQGYGKDCSGYHHTICPDDSRNGRAFVVSQGVSMWMSRYVEH